MTFLHRHNYQPVACQPWEGGNDWQVRKHTLALLRCRCGALETCFIQGDWTLAQIQGREILDELEKLYETQ